MTGHKRGQFVALAIAGYRSTDNLVAGTTCQGSFHKTRSHAVQKTVLFRTKLKSSKIKGLRDR